MEAASTALYFCMIYLFATEFSLWLVGMYLSYQKVIWCKGVTVIYAIIIAVNIVNRRWLIMYLFLQNEGIWGFISKHSIKGIDVQCMFDQFYQGLSCAPHPWAKRWVIYPLKVYILFTVKTVHLWPTSIVLNKSLNSETILQKLVLLFRRIIWTCPKCGQNQCGGIISVDKSLVSPRWTVHIAIQENMTPQHFTSSKHLISFPRFSWLTVN